MWEIISVFLLSTVKFVLGGIPLAVVVYQFPFFESVTVTTLGGCTGATFFVYSSDFLIAYFKRKRIEKKTVSTKKKFTRTNKIIVIVKHRFGLLGIALLTPLLLSIPIGCFLAVRYFKEKQRILIYMFGSVLFWSVTMYYLYKPLNYVIQKYFF
jgi:hypothetical protein